MSSIAADEIFRPQGPAVGQRDVDSDFVLCETRHLDPAMDGHRQSADPARQYAFDIVLPDAERVGMPGREVADVQGNAGELSDLGRLPLRDEAAGDSALVHDLDGARMQAACARAGKFLAGTSFDDGGIDPGQCQFAGQHQACRARSRDHHCVFVL